MKTRQTLLVLLIVIITLLFLCRRTVGTEQVECWRPGGAGGVWVMVLR